MTIRTSSIALACVLLFTTAAASAQGDDDRALAKSAIPDSTPRQVYDTSIRETGGAYRMALDECLAKQGAERKTCRQDATATYRQEMSDARQVLNAQKP